MGNASATTNLLTLMPDNLYGWHQIDADTWALGTATTRITPAEHPDYPRLVDVRRDIRDIVADVARRGASEETDVWEYTCGGVVGYAETAEAAMAKADVAANVWMTLTRQRVAKDRE